MDFLINALNDAVANDSIVGEGAKIGVGALSNLLNLREERLPLIRKDHAPQKYEYSTFPKEGIHSMQETIEDTKKPKLRTPQL